MPIASRVRRLTGGIGLAGLAVVPAAAMDQGRAVSVVLSDPDSVIGVLADADPPGIGAPRRFELVEVRKAADAIDLPDGTTLKTRIARYDMQADCAKDRLRIDRVTALDDRLRRAGEATIGSDWVEAQYPESRVTTFVCSAGERRARLEKQRFADVAALVGGAGGIMDADAKDEAARRAAAAARPSEPTGSGVSMSGVDIADCAAPTRRIAAALPLPRDQVRYADHMDAAMYREASLAEVQRICLTWGMLSGGDPFADQTLVPMNYWYALPFGDCKARWNGSCRRTYNVDVPPGFQICRERHWEDPRGDKAEVIVTPDKWLPGGGATPRFTRYVIELHSDGGYHVLDQQSANIKLHDLWVTYLSDKVGNAERARRGCAMEAKPVPPPPPKPPAPSPDLVPARISIDVATRTRLSFVVINPGGGPSQTHVVVDAYDTFFKRWMPLWAEVSNIPLSSGEAYPLDYPSTDKECWQVRFENLTTSGTWVYGGAIARPSACPYGPPPS